MAPQPAEVDVLPSVSTLMAWVVRYGLASVLLVWLIYMGVTQVVINVRHNGEMVQQHALDSAATADRMLDSLGRIERRQERIEAILRQSCVNAATDYGQRQACFAAGADR